MVGNLNSTLFNFGKNILKKTNASMSSLALSTNLSTDVATKWLKLLMLAVPAVVSSVLFLLLSKKKRVTKNFSHLALEQYAQTQAGQPLGKHIEKAIETIEGSHFGRTVATIKRIKQTNQNGFEEYVVEYELDRPDLLRDQKLWMHTIHIHTKTTEIKFINSSCLNGDA
jgi:hypothetical protein